MLTEQEREETARIAKQLPLWQEKAKVGTETRLYRSNRLVKAKIKLSIPAQRVLLSMCAALSSQSQETARSVSWVRLTTAGLKQTFPSWRRNKNLASVLKEALKELETIRIEISDGPQKWKRIGLVYSSEYNYGDLFILADPSVKAHLFTLAEAKVQGRYTNQMLGDFSDFSSSYAIRLYDLLAAEAFKKRPYEITDLEEFRGQMGVEPHQYTKPSQLLKWVVDPAVAAINEKNVLPVECEPIYTENQAKIIGLRFNYLREVIEESFTLTENQAELIAEMREIGVTESRARELAHKPAAIIIKYLWAYRRRQENKSVGPGFFIDALEKNYELDEFKEFDPALERQERWKKKRHRLLMTFLALPSEDQEPVWDAYEEWVLNFTQETVVQAWQLSGREGIHSDARVRESFTDYLNNAPDTLLPKAEKIDPLGQVARVQQTFD